jgi:tetratricopeptide (TPR) repeat protein
VSPEVREDPADILRERLRRYAAERHPLQHATAQFHLGHVLLERDALAEAEVAFTAAAALFGARGAGPERAKALNGLGATLRADGRLELATRALEHAAAGLAAAGLPLDEGAARFNLGLVLRERGDAEAAAATLTRAAELLDPAQVPAHAAAAARELGTTLAAVGRLDRAEPVLQDAVALADRARDPIAAGAAANALGLARLADGRPEEAAEAFAAAAAAHPRAGRPEAFAMAKANLALALEAGGSAPAARLAARQALAAHAVPEPVRVQAAAIVARLGRDDADLLAVLTAEPEAGRAALAREELARGRDAGQEDRAADARAWVRAHLGWPGDPAEVAELWLGALLELPPDVLERLVRDALRIAVALGPEDRETFRTAVTRAMVRFHIPQWTRLQDVFSRAAEEAGDPGPWR